MDYLKTQVVEVTECGAEYGLIRFKGERPIAGRPGQFVMVRGQWGQDLVLPRAFSLVEAGEIGAIFVRVVGEGTRRLVSLKPGDDLFVLGPNGHGYSQPTTESTPVLVAGGVGVAPLIFLAEQLAQAGVKPVCIYGARSGEDLPLAERYGMGADFKVTTEDGSEGVKGLVTDALQAVLAEHPNAHIFSCGPEGMLEAVAKMAVARKVPCEIAMESPMACGMGTCKGCAILAASGEYRYVCSDGPAFEAKEIYGGDK